MTTDTPEPFSTELPTVTVQLADMQPHPDNPNEGDEDAISAAFDDLGYVVPMIVQAPRGRRKRYRILDGEHRWRQLRERGVTTADVVVLDISDAEALRVLATVNPVARKGADDPTKLLHLLGRIADTSRGLDGTGYSHADHEKLIAQANAAAKAAMADENDDTFRRGLRKRASDYEGMGNRQIILVMSRDQHQWATDAINQLRTDLGLDTSSDVVLSLLAQALDDDVPD